MNSSGIKRGLAGSAVAALAVTGLPFLASSADAATGDSIAVVSTGPALNGGSVGAVVVLRTKNVDPTMLDLTGASSATAGSEDTADQTVDIVGTPTSAADPDNAGFDLITMHIATTTSTDGATASFRVFEDDNAGLSDVAGSLDADEARVSESIMTSGPVAAIDIAPATQSAAQGQTSGAYTATLKDSAGRTTQLAGGDSVGITTDDATVTTSESGGTITAAEAEKGTRTFTASSTLATPVGAHAITLTDATTTTIKGNATLNVTRAASIQAGEVDIVTGADNWNGFGDGTDGGTTLVRVDQSSIRIDFKSNDVSDRNATVTLNVNSASMTFGGKASTTVTTVLDANGVGSVTITPDALTVQAGDSLTISGSFGQTINFQRSAPTFISADQDPYFGKLKGSVDVKVTVTDQFNAPVTTGFIGAQRLAGPNTPDPQQAKPVDATGSATFTFADTKATNGQIDTVGFGYVPDQFTPPASANPTGATHIKWTTTGEGADFKTFLDGTDTEGATYKASDVTVDPLADAHADSGSEWAEIDVTSAEHNQGITVSVDNGALIVPDGAGSDNHSMTDGKSSVTGTTDALGEFTGYRVIGTKAGVVTVTVTSASRTETAQMTVNAETDLSSARNVTVSGPATVPAGTTQVAYTAVVTDAFGNPIAGFPRSAGGTDLINIQVSGPGHFQDGDPQTNANGEMVLNVGLDSGAEGDVTIKVTGLSGGFFLGATQFGAAADQIMVGDPAGNGKGLPASSNIANATTTVEGAPVKADPNLTLSGSSSHGKDKIKANADDAAAGATATLWVHGVKKKTGTLNASGNFTFSIKDRNGSKKTKYVVKVSGTAATTKASASISQK